MCIWIPSFFRSTTKWRGGGKPRMDQPPCSVIAFHVLRLEGFEIPRVGLRCEMVFGHFMVMQLLVVPFVLLSVLMLENLGAARAMCGHNAWVAGRCINRKMIDWTLASMFRPMDFGGPGHHHGCLNHGVAVYPNNLLAETHRNTHWLGVISFGCSSPQSGLIKEHSLKTVGWGSRVETVVLRQSCDRC